jgi:hypothetical protein
MPTFRAAISVHRQLTSGANERVVTGPPIIRKMIALVAVTAFALLAILGTVGKMLFDDRRVRQAARLASALFAPAHSARNGKE